MMRHLGSHNFRGVRSKKGWRGSEFSKSQNKNQIKSDRLISQNKNPTSQAEECARPSSSVPSMEAALWQFDVHRHGELRLQADEADVVQPLPPERWQKGPHIYIYIYMKCIEMLWFATSHVMKKNINILMIM